MHHRLYAAWRAYRRWPLFWQLATSPFVIVVLLALFITSALLGLAVMAVAGVLFSTLFTWYGGVTGAYAVSIVNDSANTVEIRERCSDFGDPPPGRNTHVSQAFCPWYDTDAQPANIASAGATLTVTAWAPTERQFLVLDRSGHTLGCLTTYQVGNAPPEAHVSTATPCRH